MVTLRCTQKLLKRMKVSPDRDTNTPTTRLGDWYANLLYINRQQIVLCISEVTYLAVVLPAKDSASLTARLTAGVEQMLRWLQLPQSDIATELGAMQNMQIGRTDSRRTLGVLNDTAFMLEAHLAYQPDVSLDECSQFLAGTIHMPIKDSPDDATRLLVGLQPIQHRRKI